MYAYIYIYIYMYINGLEATYQVGSAHPSRLSVFFFLVVDTVREPLELLKIKKCSVKGKGMKQRCRKFSKAKSY